jgi:hypothetical protein
MRTPNDYSGGGNHAVTTELIGFFEKNLAKDSR